MKEVCFLSMFLAASSAWGETDPENGEIAAEDAGYTPAESDDAFTFGGYLDLGFADAGGNGTSFHSGNTLLPADYGVDAFAPAVNSRGDVASNDAQGLFTNGFLPRTMGIGGRPSFFVNTLNFDLRYDVPNAPLLFFSRVQLLPRLGAEGSHTRVLLEQAFGRIVPFDSQELALSVGKFDPVFGIEYLENQASLRTGIVPSLAARYTTGQAVGAKAFYRVQIAPLWSSVSLNVAVTNSPPFVEVLQPSEISLTGRPVLSGRIGYDLNLPGMQLKLGGSALTGSRNDQGDPSASQRMWGADLRAYVRGVSLHAEYVHVDQEGGRAADKQTGGGPATIPSPFWVRAYYVFLGYELPFSGHVFRRSTVYARFEHRYAWFGGFVGVTGVRLVAGARLDLWEALALKGEYLRNAERKGAPTIDNDVVAGSLVFSF